LKAYPIWQKRLRDHQAPRLVLLGRYDPSFVVAGAEAYRKDVAGGEVHILDAGHFALDEQAGEVIRLTEPLCRSSGSNSQVIDRHPRLGCGELKRNHRQGTIQLGTDTKTDSRVTKDTMPW